MKIRENSEKTRGPPGVPKGPSTTLFRPLKKFWGPYGPLKDQNKVKFAQKESENLTFSGNLAAELGPLACLAAALGPLACLI